MSFVVSLDSFPDTVFTLSTSSTTVKRSLHEFELLNHYLIITYPHFILPSPPFVSKDQQWLKETCQTFLSIVNEKIENDAMVVKFLTDTFTFDYALVPSSPPKVKLQEIDPWFEEKYRIYTGLLDKMKRMGKKNRELSLDVLEMELIPIASLKIQFKRIDFETFSDEILLLYLNTQRILTVLDYRLYLQSEYTESCKKTVKRLNEIEKLKNSSTISQTKVTELIEELSRVKINEEKARHVFKEKSEEIKSEIEAADHRRVCHFQAVLAKYAERMVKANKDHLRTLKVVQGLYVDMKR